jgi:WD40 repeat protein
MGNLIFCVNMLLPKHRVTRCTVFSLCAFVTLVALAFIFSKKEVPMIKMRATLHSTGRQFLSLAFSPDGRYLAAGQQDGTVTMWDTVSMTAHTVASARNVPVYDFSAAVLALAFSPDGRLLAWGGGDKQASVFDINRTKVKSVYQHESFVESLVFAEKGKILVTATEDGLVRCWNTETGKTHVVFEEKKSKYMMRDTPHIASIAINPQSTFLAVGIYGSIIIFNGSDRTKEHAVARGYKTEIKSLCFSSDGKKLVGIADGTVVIWDPESAKESAYLYLRSPGISLSSVAFSPPMGRSWL